MTKTRERTRRIEKPKGRLLKALADKSAAACRSSGRNSAGRITSFHRGGGSKRIHRNVDLKHDVSATGVVERVEYDSTRSSCVALVRWIDGVNGLIRSVHVAPSPPATYPPPAGELLESPSVSSSFSLASLPGNMGQSVGNRISSAQAKTLPKGYVLIGGVPKQA